MKTDRDKLARVLFDQIVVRDCYGIRTLQQPPDVVVDVGANCGVFSMTARVLFPQARVISVEPCPETFAMLEDNLKFYGCDLHNVALSKDPFVRIWHGRDSGSNSTISAKDINKEDGPAIPGMTLAEMFRRWLINPEKQRVLLKVDCEGAERVIVEDPQSEKLVFPCVHACFEMHYCDGRGASKWANALSKYTAEAWIKYVKQTWQGQVHYEHHCMGSVEGGILVLSNPYE